MQLTIADIMAEVRNYFNVELCRGRDWSVSNGVLSGSDELQAGDWIAVGGASLCSGVWKLGEGLTLEGMAEGMADGHFRGRVWRLSPPPAFISLCETIIAWCADHPHVTAVSERFGSYAVTNATGPGGAPLTWQQVFAVDLYRWRRMLTEVRLDG